VAEEAGDQEQHAQAVAPGSLGEAQEDEQQEAHQVELPGLAERIEVLVEELTVDLGLGGIDLRVDTAESGGQAPGRLAEGFRVLLGVGGCELREALRDRLAGGILGTPEVAEAGPAAAFVEDGNDG
jgi:hypothetical protein